MRIGAVLLSLFWVCGTVAAGASQEALTDIASHYLTVTLTPDDSFLAAVDRVELSQPAEGDFSFTLNRNLVIDYIKCDGTEVGFGVTPYEGEGIGETAEGETVQVVTAHFPYGATNFEIAYSGVICDPVDPSSALGRVRGDFTSGIISPDGVYLSPETGWYPDTSTAMAVFEIESHVPKGWLTVTQGELLTQTEVGEESVSTWKSTMPADGCVLVANRYFVTSRDIAGVKCSTYFYDDNPALASSFLDRLEQYLPAYQELFGPFPYSRFDVVENFFSTGYGMPGFTLLGSRVLTMPYATAEGSLAHELVHNWWGNSVFVDWDRGNWCEGLTYFSTNYYWNIISGNEQKAADFRFLSLMKYSVQVHPEDEYPLRQFRTKMTEVDGCIGYDKSSFVFIMLHQMLGEDRFFESLRLFRERFTGMRAGWEDIEAVFEEVSGRDLSSFFSSWLDNRGIPELLVDYVAQEQRGDQWVVTARILQAGEMFYFPLEIVAFSSSGESSSLNDVGPLPFIWEAVSVTRFNSITIDPGHFLFRRLARDEIPPCLNLTLEADSLLVVVPSGGETEMVDVQEFGFGAPATRRVSVKDLFSEVADSVLRSGTPATVKTDVEVTEEDLKGSSVLCLGGARYNSVTARLAQDSELFKVSDGWFAVGDVEYGEEGQSLLVSARNPFNPARDMTIYHGNSPQSMLKAKYIFFYGWDSFVAFQNGNVINRGRWSVPNSLSFQVD